MSNDDAEPTTTNLAMVAQLKSALLPDRKEFLSSQVQDLRTNLIGQPNSGNSQGQVSFGKTAKRSPVHPSGLPDEDDDYESESEEIDPLKSLETAAWNPPDQTRDALNKYMRRKLSKHERAQLLERFPNPNLPVAQVPELDSSIQHILSQKKLNVRQIPGALALEAVQTRMLDAAGPLAALHNAATKAQCPAAVLEAINHSLLFLGNANSQAIYQRQRALMSKLNPSAVSLLTHSEITDSKDLFGANIRKTIKEATDARKEFGISTETRSFAFKPRSRAGRGNWGGLPRSNTRFQPYQRGRQFSGRSYARNTSNHGPVKGDNNNIPQEIGGRLKYYEPYWRSLTEDAWVLYAICGYFLPFVEYPGPCLNPPPHVIKNNENLIEQEIKNLLEKQAIEKADSIYFLSQIFVIPKKDGVSVRPILNLKPVNKYLKSEKFKMESVTMIRDLLQKGMWMAKIDLKDAYFTVPVARSHRKYLQFRWKDVVYQYKCLPFGLSSAPYAFTKITKPLVSLLRSCGIRLIIYLDDVFTTDVDKETTLKSIDFVVEVFTSAGFVINKERSVCVPVQCLEYLGLVVNSEDSIETGQNKKCCLVNFAEGNDNSTNAGSMYWTHNLYTSRSSNMLSENTQLPILSNTSSEDIQLGSTHSINEGSNEGYPMVVHKFKSVAPIPNNKRGRRGGDRVRRKLARLGFQMRRSDNWGTMDRAGFEVTYPHKSAGTVCRFFKSAMLCAKNCSCKIENGQSHSCRIRQQIRGYQVLPSKSISNTDVGMVSATGNLDYRRILTRNIEPSCGLGVQTQLRLQQLETLPTDISADNEDAFGQGRPICGPQQSSASKILELEAGSRGGRSRRIHDNMEEPQRLCLSSLLPHRPCSEEMHRGECNSNTNSSYLDQSGLVPTTDPQSSGFPMPSSSIKLTLDQSTRDSAPTGNYQSASNGRMEGDRRSANEGEISQETEDLLMCSIRPKSRKSYDSAWKIFSGWCSERNIDPLQVSINNILDYLTRLYKNGLAYSTINLHRSALAFHLPNLHIGSEIRVKKLVRGVFNLNPPLPRYVFTCNPSMLVNFIGQIPDNPELSLADLTKKLVCLLALTKACRSSDICSLDIQGMMENNEGVVFRQLHLTKTARPGFRPNFIFPKYLEVSKLCVVATLDYYISATKEFRKDFKLILTTKKPHHPATTSTISRWMLDFMKRAGINTDEFKAHSVRGAATSKANKRGVSLHDIQQCADWTSSNTFLLFYNRYCPPSQFASSVISPDNVLN